MMTRLTTLAALTLVATASIAQAQWNPANGQWGKTDPADLRVMTWNIEDGVVSTSTRKSQASLSDWDGIARIIAGLKPDILIIQEAGDRSGNGSGSGVDSVTQLERAFEQLIEGGTDEFNANAVIQNYIQKYDPTYDLPYKFVSTVTDGFNRNVILSRFPFADLNGDCIAERAAFFHLPDGPAFGNGGIRGFATAEVDLPDDVYAHDIVIGNSHLKSGGSTSDRNDRQEAAENIAAYIRNLFDGRLSGTPDPLGVVTGPDAAKILADGTPVVWGGDWNEDHTSNSFPGAPETMVQNILLGGTDGTDRDGTDSTFDSAREPFTNARGTLGSSKLDYIAYQDSQVAGIRREFVFNSGASGISVANLPPEVRGYIPTGTLASAFAADHRPVVVDFILETVQPGETSCDRIDMAAPFGQLTFGDISAYLSAFSASCLSADLVAPFGQFTFGDISTFIARYSTGCP
jgi:endonuclease/exonuclease/phosphatase family metal-dependent hydrolase